MHRLRYIRAIAAAIVLGIFTALFLDFMRWVPEAWANVLPKWQLVSAWQTFLFGAAWGGGGILMMMLLGTLVFGRIYCSILCPVGILQDVCSRISRRIKKPSPQSLRFTPPVKWVRPLVIALAIIFTACGLGAFFWTWLDPYSQFGRLCTFVVRPILIEAHNLLASTVFSSSAGWSAIPPMWPAWSWVAVVALLITVLALVMAAMKDRLYCNTICPIGAILGIISRFSAFRIRIDATACIKCAQCAKSCKSHCIDFKTGRIDHSRCVSCFNCIPACKGRGVHYSFAWKKIAAPCTTTSHTLATVTQASPSITRRNLMIAAIAGSAATVARKTNGTVSAPASVHMPVTPPGSHDTEHFLDACTGCQLCIKSCPTGCLIPATWEYGLTGMFKPVAQFHAGYCNFNCTRCGEVCPTGAIKHLRLAEKQLTAIGKVKFTLKKCIVAKDKTDCGACAEHCPTRALEMVPFQQPVIDPNYCVACKSCIRTCPQHALSLVNGTSHVDTNKCIGCQTCAKSCKYGALEIQPVPSGIKYPKLTSEYCIGCGACEHACPASPSKAMAVSGLLTHDRATQLIEAPVADPNAGKDFAF